jgi:LAO/AO transport system kinase
VLEELTNIRNTTEAIILCEEAGYDMILVETVGVGQSETAVESMVDMYVLLVLPSGGDELQGIKKGVVEYADLIIVNKTDGDLVRASRVAQYEYLNALKFINPKTPLWKPKVLPCSSVTQEGIDKIWTIMSQYLHIMKDNNLLTDKRSKQSEDWMWRILNETFQEKLLQDTDVAALLPKTKEDVRNHKVTPTQAAMNLLTTFFQKNKK